MNEIEWHPEKMLEIKLKEPDVFPSFFLFVNCAYNIQNQNKKSV